MCTYVRVTEVFHQVYSWMYLYSIQILVGPVYAPDALLPPLGIEDISSFTNVYTSVCPAFTFHSVTDYLKFKHKVFIKGMPKSISDFTAVFVLEFCPLIYRKLHVYSRWKLIHLYPINTFFHFFVT